MSVFLAQEKGRHRWRDTGRSEVGKCSLPQAGL